MSISSFLKFVEIRTKLASVIPFILGTLFCAYRYKTFNPANFIIMFISLFAFDMATTAINNYCDFRKAHKDFVKSHESENAIVEYNLTKSQTLSVIFILLGIATIFGIALTLRTNLVVFLIGAVSFFIGVFYTFGPIPISRMPLGELFSGFFMGFVIFFLSIYIHIFDKNIISLAYKNGIIYFGINVVEILYIFLVSLPLIVGIANIMFANNICDLKKDILNKRFTLAYYLGKDTSLKLFRLLYYIGYADIVILLMLKLLPIWSLLSLATLISVNKNINTFCDRPVKSETFVLAVKNFVLMNLSQILIILITLIINIIRK